MKLGGWIITLTVMVLILTIIGLPTGFTTLLETMGFKFSPAGNIDAYDLSNSTFWSWIFGLTGILAVLGGGGLVVIGLFGKGYDPSLVYAPFIVLAGATFVSVFLRLFVYVANLGYLWMTSIMAVILVAMGTGFVMACVDYFGGR